MKPELAVDDKDTPFSHVAFEWEPDQGMWNFLCAGRTADEFEHRVSYWISRGTDPDRIRKYACTPPAAATAQQLQAVEGESWGEWVGRLRAAQNRITTENMGNPPQPPAQQPVPISVELWAVIHARRPGAYETLQKYNVQHAIITVGTSRTKLEFPDCPDVGHGANRWSQFDRDNMNPNRPILVLDGTPETGFKPFPGLRELGGLT